MHWRIDGTTVSPPVYTTTAQEDVLLSLDATSLLVDGDAPSAPRSVLTRVDRSIPVTLADSPNISGSNVVQRIRNLQPGLTYRLRVTFTTSEQDRSMTLYIECVR